MVAAADTFPVVRATNPTPLGSASRANASASCISQLRSLRQWYGRLTPFIRASGFRSDT
jgi:hypothetical protein